MASGTSPLPLRLLRPLLLLEAVVVLVLAAEVVRLEALFGKSEEQLKSGISAVEQVIWNMQKCARCTVLVLCFSSKFYISLPQKLASWPTLVFAHMARELWLLPGREPHAYLWRRRACLALITTSRAALGTIRSYLRLRAAAARQERPGNRICSNAVLGWIIFLLDTTANCGFLLGFWAGRRYFFEDRRDPRGAVAERRRPSKAYSSDSIMKRPRPKPKEEEEEEEDASAGTTASPEEKHTGAHQATSQPEEHEQLPSRLEEPFQGRNAVFWCYAKLALAGLVVASLLECYFLQHWEAGILGARDDEVDVFHSDQRYFKPLTPDLSRWRVKRIVFGSWRDIIYMVLIYPVASSVAFGFSAAVLYLAYRFHWRRIRHTIERLCWGAMTYLVLVSAHRAYFALICILICWECRELELKALAFARAFPELSPKERWERHAGLGSEIKELDDMLAPLISYVFLQRLAYLGLDLARQSCDVGLPFNLVHYLFRHVMFLSALALTSWRIGKLNFAFYEKLHNVVMDLFPRNWAGLGHDGVGQDVVILQRMHLEDWRQYLNHNVDSGRREACIRVLHLRWAAKSHVLALSIITILTLPLMNKVLDTYSRHVVNERLLPSTPDLPFSAEQVCEASAAGE